MRANWNAALRDRVRDAAGTGRIIVEGRAEIAADVRQTPGSAFGGPLGWSDADNWASVYPSALELLSDGGLRIKAAAGGSVGPSGSATPGYQSYVPGGGISPPYIDPLPSFGIGPQNFPNNATFAGVLGQWQGAAAGVRYGSATCFLNPHYDTTKPQYVTTWVFTIWQVVGGLDGHGIVDPASGVSVWSLIRLVTAIQGASQVAGNVTFNFAGAIGATDAEWHPDPYDPVTQQGAQYWFTVNGYDAMGQPATNVGWDTYGAATSYSFGSTVTFQGRAAAPLPPNVSIAGISGTAEDGGVIALPLMQLTPIAFSGPVTLTFKTAHQISLAQVPVVPPEVVVRGDLPPGTAITSPSVGAVGDPPTCDLAAHMGSPYTTVQATDGETTDQAGVPTAQQLFQSWDVSVQLIPSSDGSRSPILRAVGLRAVTTVDLGDVATVTSWQERLDPLTHISEIAQCTIEVLRDGEPDYQDKITQLIANNPVAKLYFRVWMGDRSLPKNQWLHLEDFLIDEHDPRAASINIIGVSPLALMRQALPKLAADAPAYPIGDDSNPGGWTGVGYASGLGLYTAIADVANGGPFGSPLDTTYVQVVNPNTAQYSVFLSAVSAPPQAIPNQVFIQARCAIAAAGAITIKVELFEGSPTAGGTLRATLPVTTITTVDTGEGSYFPIQYSLSDMEVSPIGNWGNLYLRFTASPGVAGTGTLRVGWARLVVTGTRAPLTYPSQFPATVQSCAQDLIQNQVELPCRYAGFAYVKPTP